MAHSSDTVMLGYVHPTEVSAYFLVSILGLVLHDKTFSHRIVGVEHQYSSANISHERNNLVRTFLDKYDADWLFMVDADMYFDPETLDLLLKTARADTRPVLGGLCFGISDGQLFPTLYDIAQDDTGQHILRRNVWPKDEVVQVTATGAACVLIHRSVLEAVRDKGFNRTFPWFQETELNGDPCGEDFTFCLRAGLCGYQIHVDTSVSIGHHKSMILDRAMYAKQTGLAL